jgi:hypothetical protein
MNTDLNELNDLNKLNDLNIDLNELNDLNELIGFTFEIDFNECNLNRFNFNKKIKPLLNELEKYQKTEKLKETEKNIIDKIKLKIDSELNDEKDLVSIYNSKITKLIEKLKQENLETDIDNKIKETIETPLEGEMAKHNKIKVVIVKLIKKDKLDVMFYVKYKQIERYNKQIKKLYDSFLKL